jgi:predicted metal-dependent peptidase
MDLQTKLKRAHIRLLREKETALYGGIILAGESSIVEDSNDCPTAYTDGWNKRYGAKFLEMQTDLTTTGLVLHENLHVFLKHLPRHRDLMKQDARLANMAMDYVVNDIIVELSKKCPTLIKLPDDGLYDPMFHDWSVREIYNYLKDEQDKGGGGERGNTLDEHGDELVEGMTPEETQAMNQKITEAIQQGALLASKFGATIPRAIKDLMEPKVDWREALRDFLQSHTRGKDEYTWSKFNKRRIADDHYLPSMYSEKVGEVVVAIDTSGSISNDVLSEFASELASICEVCTPDVVRVLWWDTKVHGEQVFTDEDGTSIVSMLKPQGFGGTRVSSVSEYINNNKITPECVIVFTDGHVENNVEWRVDAPTLWMITKNNKFKAPSGLVVKVD